MDPRLRGDDILFIGSLLPLRPLGNCSCMAQASLSTGSRSHLLPAVVLFCGYLFYLVYLLFTNRLGKGAQ
jgi:hypothetical protein